ncbi:ExbD/TolR family protein [Rhodospirillaceae bacterium SYSU D60014]|uniref:ExbD/TolR family protein n=1 Tax=Virgifigura deserti TaxID=2268457 RepID=UPI0013C45D57
MIPLINIVFLLLIFFMLAGTLSATDLFEVAPPESASEEAVGEPEMVVLMAADGRLALDGQDVDEAGLRQQVAAKLAADPDMRVRLKADGATEAEQVITVMEMLRAAGVTELTLLAAARG